MNEGIEETEFDTINITLQQHWLLEILLEGKSKCNMFFSQRHHYSYDLQTVLFAIWHNFSLKIYWRTGHCLIQYFLNLTALVSKVILFFHNMHISTRIKANTHTDDMQFCDVICIITAIVKTLRNTGYYNYLIILLNFWRFFDTVSWVFQSH